MSYISALRKGNDVVVWERTSEGREMKLFPAPYYFYIKDPDGPHKSMYGDKLSRVDFDTAKEFNMAKSECESNKVEMFESDIPPELKFLSETYYDVPAPVLHVTFLDIEVDYVEELGFSSIQNPYAPINSVAYYHNWTKRMVVYAVPPSDYKGDPDDLLEEGFLEKLRAQSEFESDVTVEFKLCKDEKELLMYLLVEIADSDVLSGWNSDFFDIPYIGKRLDKVLGAKYFSMLSFAGANKPRWRTIEIMRRDMETLDLSGRASLDYMVLFKKYEMYEQPSYKLESVADVVIVDPITKKPTMPKIVYEGSLANLYRTDFIKFVRYNLRDTEILKGFEDRLGYVDTANKMYHMSTALPSHVTGTLKLAELASINACHHELGGLIVNDNHMPDEDAQIQGAFVLLPQVGMHEKLGAVDIKSLYPSAIMALNISPEKIVGQFIEKVRASEEIAKNSDVEITLIVESTGEEVTAAASLWREQFLNAAYAVSGYGTVFDQNEEGIIPAILAGWYAKRKEFQNLKGKAKAAGDEDRTLYYDKLQYVYKIKLNSFYGALANKYFRFYDLRMGESTTGTGRMILLHQCAEVCKILDSEYAQHDRFETDKNGKEHFGYSDKYSVIYGDTDSTYFLTHADTDEDSIKIADEVGKLCNESFPAFMKNAFLCGEGYDQKIQTGREIVADRGIFVDKKRYILHIIDDEGDAVDKMKIMGLDTKKTTMPKHISIKLNNFVGRLLKGEDWSSIAPDVVDLKTTIETAKDFIPYGLPKGVQGVEDYTNRYKIHGNDVRLPGHVAASIVYNMCLEEYGDKQSTPIYSGMKIKVFYLTKKIGRFISIALPVDIEQVPDWFIEDFLPIIDRDAHILRLVDKPLGNIIKAVGIQVPTKQSLILDDLFVD